MPDPSLDPWTTLQALDGFHALWDRRRYRPVPADWCLVITDVVGSTTAIAQGRYKDVNSAGSLGIMAVANLLGHLDFPFVFGGDGMACLVPPPWRQAVRGTMKGLVGAVRQAFDLEIRAAMVPVGELYRRGARLDMARLQVSPSYVQAILDGDGIDLAEDLVKGSDAWLINPEGAGRLEPDLRGYSCRWKDYPSPRGETVALIIKPRAALQGREGAFLDDLQGIIGGEGETHPLRQEASRPRWSWRDLRGEVILATGTTRGLRAWAWKWKVRIEIIAVQAAVRLCIPIRQGTKDVRQAVEENLRSSDYRKFDGTIKMVVALEPQQRRDLEAWLARAVARGVCWYGLHVSDRATLTCLLKTDQGQEVHFVDAADGGYAYAARMLKEMMAESPISEPRSLP